MSDSNSLVQWENVQRRIRPFNPEATILLVGARGAGKSSLAVMTAMALKKRFIDLLVTFETLCGESFETMRERDGREFIYKKEAELLENLLERYPTNCVISTSSNSVEEPTRSILMKYRHTMPIIHITRYQEDLDNYLSRLPDYHELVRLSELRKDWYRACSDFEFLNLSRGSHNDGLGGLKNVQQEFLQFLRQIYDSKFSLPDPNIYTHSLLMPYADLTHLDIEEVTIGVDAIQIRADLMALWATRNGKDVFHHISVQMAHLRRHNSHIPVIYDMGNTSPDKFEGTSHGNNIYWKLLGFGFRVNADYIFIEREYFNSGPSPMGPKGNTKIIGGYKVNVWEPAKLKDIINDGTMNGCDLICITSYALELSDNFQIPTTFQKLIQEGIYSPPHSRLIYYNEGTLGKLSRCTNHIFTPVSHPSFWNDSQSFYYSASSSSQHLILPIEHVAEYRDNIEGTMSVREANAIAHSLNLQPRKYLFYFGIGTNYWGAMLQYSIDSIGVSFSFCEKSIGEISHIRQILSSHNFGGAFVSEAFKESILSELPSSSVHSKIIGASNIIVSYRDANTLKINSLKAENTEWIGLFSSITKNLATKNAITSSTSAVVIGTGGLGRAAVFALLNLGVKNIFIHDNDIWNAKKVISNFHGIAEEVPFFHPVSNVEQADNTVMSMRYITRTKGNLSQSDTQRPKTFGTMSFETTSDTPSLGCLDSLTCDWPSDISSPSIIVNCSHDSDFELHPSWFANPTGGLGIDIGRGSQSKFFHQLEALKHQGKEWVNVLDAEVWIEVANSSLGLLTGKRSSLKLLRQAVYDLK